MTTPRFPQPGLLPLQLRGRPAAARPHRAGEGAREQAQRDRRREDRGGGEHRAVEVAVDLRRGGGATARRSTAQVWIVRNFIRQDRREHPRNKDAAFIENCVMPSD